MGEGSPRPDVSAAINISRILCILGVVYVHAWTGLTAEALNALNGTPQADLRWVLIELLGRSAVPLLGVISGWLVAAAVKRRSYRAFLSGKMRTLLAPLLAWNAIAMIIVCGAASLGWLSAPTPPNLWWIVNELFCLTAPNDVNVQMYFVRDLFVCMSFAPLLVRLPDWGLATIGAAVFVWFGTTLSFPLLLKPQILLFFILGIVARRREWERVLGNLRWRIVLAPYVLLAPVKILVSLYGGALTKSAPEAVNVLDLALRLSAALLVWRFAMRLVSTSVGERIRQLSSVAFLLFCSHMVFIWIGGPTIGRLTGPLGSKLYPLFLLSQPLLVLAAALGLRAGLSTLPYKAADLLTGRRTGRPLTLQKS
jgi:surface polysaccharide O-acyltransferase-like enzyme